MPFTTASPVMPGGFAIYDRALVRVESNAGVVELTDPESVARFSGWLDQLVDASLTGTEAADFCQQVAASLPD